MTAPAVLCGLRDHNAGALVAPADCNGCHGPMQPGLDGRVWTPVTRLLSRPLWKGAGDRPSPDRLLPPRRARGLFIRTECRRRRLAPFAPLRYFRHSMARQRS